jgi:hypothetical protein
MEIVVGVFKGQKSQVSLGFAPPHRLTHHWKVVAIFSSTTFAHKTPSSGRRVESALIAAFATYLQIALQIGVPKVCSLIIRQQVDRFMRMEQTESPLVSLQVTSHNRLPNSRIRKRAFT